MIDGSHVNKKDNGLTTHTSPITFGISAIGHSYCTTQGTFAPIHVPRVPHSDFFAWSWIEPLNKQCAAAAAIRLVYSFYR